MPAYVTVGSIGSQISFHSGEVDPGLFVPTGYKASVPDNHTLIRSFTPASTGTHLISIKNHRLKAMQVAAWEATNVPYLVYKGSKAGDTDLVQMSVDLTAAQKYLISVNTQLTLLQTMLRLEYAPAPLVATCVAPVWASHAAESPGTVRLLSNPPPGVEFYWRVSGSENNWILWDGQDKHVNPGLPVEAIGVGPNVCEGNLVRTTV